MTGSPILGRMSSSASHLHVVVLGGGDSTERNVSLSTARALISSCRQLGHDVTFVDPLFIHDTQPRAPASGPFVASDSLSDRANEIQNGCEFIARLAASQPSVVLNGLHGGCGEDGTIQGVLEYLQLPYSHSGVAASALATDKLASRSVFSTRQMNVARGYCYSPQEVASTHVMDRPYIVKPRYGGSSVAVALVQEGDAPPADVVLGPHWPGEQDVLVEEFIAGREITCAVCGNQPMGVIEIITERVFYDYIAKYDVGGSVHVAAEDRLHVDTIEEIRDASLQAHEALGCSGVSRTDFRLDDGGTGRGTPVVLELNTQPGMTETSLVPDMVRAMGYGFDDMVQWMIEDALCRCTNHSMRSGTVSTVCNRPPRLAVAKTAQH